MKKLSCRGVLAAELLVVGLVLEKSSFAQYNERPDLAGFGSPAVDVSGRSIKNQRVRAIHTDDAEREGGTAYFIQKDPFLAYQLGRNLNFREFRERDGIFDAKVCPLAGPMPDEATAKITANNQTSCVGCHNQPQGNPGGGANFHKDSGRGRNSPHYYGAGVVEMLALQIRADLLFQLDANQDGWVSVAEATAHGPSLEVQATAKGPSLDYGDPTLSNGATGKPSLNNIFRVWYVDANGRVVEGAHQVDGVTTFGYNFEMIVWGWGQGPGRAALNPTNRAFLWDPWKAHGGLEAYDPTTVEDPDGDGISGPTLSGAIQFPVTHRPRDAGDEVDALGFSRDDPDGDGHLNEISEGDLDLAEWFMLNAPRPAFAERPHKFREGVRLLEAMKCADCHVEAWTIRAQDETFAGDRRLFDFEVTWNKKARRLEGKLVPLYQRVGDRFVPDRDSFQVPGIFTDLRHHDLGMESAELDFGGNLNTLWRTAPLWGVGSGFPWHHDGASLTLVDSILRHGGEAAESRQRYLDASERQRSTLLEFLRNLVLYDIESLPADIDGDGLIAEHFLVQGMDTGTERFNAEWLFRKPLQIQGPFLNTDGVTIVSFAGVNVAEAYGEDLPLRLDSDHDGWADVWDHAPQVPGYRDGEN